MQVSERAGLKNLRVDRHRREAGHPNEPCLKQIARNHHGTTFCCSPALQSSIPRGQCNAGSGWVADTYLFTDTLRPGGVARSEAAFHADEHRALVRFVRRLHGYYGVVQLRPRSAERRALLLALQ
jgi:hypothetical protein